MRALAVCGFGPWGVRVFGAEARPSREVRIGKIRALDPSGWFSKGELPPDRGRSPNFRPGILNCGFLLHGLGISSGMLGLSQGLRLWGAEAATRTKGFRYPFLRQDPSLFGSSLWSSSWFMRMKLPLVTGDSHHKSIPWKISGKILVEHSLGDG